MEINKITGLIQKSLQKIRIEEQEIFIEIPSNSSFGDYSTNIAMKLTKKLKKTPFEIAKDIVDVFPKSDFINKVDVIKPGFINFWLSNNVLITKAKQLAESEFNFKSFNFGPTKKVMVEFAHPNTHKLFHIGHLRNISTGESIVRLLETAGNKLIRANYQGDIGLHIAKCLFRIKDQESKIRSLKTLKEKIDLLGKSYSEGQEAYESSEQAKKEIHEINKMIYDQDKEIFSLWEETRKWSLEYFNQNYGRVYSKFDRLYFESEISQRGVKIAKTALKKGVLKESQGAIVFNGKKYGLDTRVFINSLGFPTYEGKELALAELEFSEFGEIDKCIHTVTPEQTSFFKVTFKVEELLDEKKYKGKQHHLVYEWVKLKSGKMSSREGNVIEGNWLLDEVKKQIIKQFKCNHEIAETLAVASVKYSFLKNSLQTPIAFDLDESIATDGNSAPYLIYTYVRTQSVLNKVGNFDLASNASSITNEESQLLRSLYKYEETVYKAASGLSPNIIANYLFELSKQFNFFYQKCPIIKASDELKNFRLLLTKATGQIIKNGLYLLGIRTVERM